MSVKMDKVLEKLVFIVGSVMSNTSEEFRKHKPSDRTRKILRLLEVHGLARLVRRKGAVPTWTATESLIRQAGIFSAEAQPNPVHEPIANSHSAIFNCHLRRCINWVERDFKIEHFGPQRQPGSDCLLSVFGLKHEAFARVLRNALAIEREGKYEGSKGR